MAIEVTKADNDLLYVNDKEVYRDASGNWVARQELTTSELTALNDYITKHGLR